MPAPLLPLRALLIALLLAAAPACGQRELVPTGLPPEFAVRSDAPYVRGTIIGRDEPEPGAVRLRVRDRPNSDWRVLEPLPPLVTSDAILVGRDR